MNRTFALALSLAALPLIGACGSDTDGGGGGGTAVSQPSDSASVSDASVSIADFMFTDAEVHLAVGGSVTWTNDDNQPHTATSSGNFDAGAIDPSKSSTVEFSTAGTFTYVCSFHPFMHGTIVVE
ncbi:hypothetical protein BH10ACT2_BH10ACT2_27320 [soil metagenome]